MINKRYLVVASVLFAMAASSSSWAQQYARPDATTDNGGFSAVPAVPHHETVDETAAATSDYVDSGVANTGTIIFSLSAVSDPDVGTGHVVRFNCKVEGTRNPAEQCNFALYDGGNLIYQSTNEPASRGAWETFAITVPTANADTITPGGYSNLTIQLTSNLNNKAQNGESVQFGHHGSFGNDYCRNGS
jgi:hypothetical protein